MTFIFNSKKCLCFIFELIHLIKGSLLNNRNPNCHIVESQRDYYNILLPAVST